MQHPKGIGRQHWCSGMRADTAMRKARKDATIKLGRTECNLTVEPHVTGLLKVTDNFTNRTSDAGTLLPLAMKLSSWDPEVLLEMTPCTVGCTRSTYTAKRCEGCRYSCNSTECRFSCNSKDGWVGGAQLLNLEHLIIKCMLQAADLGLHLRARQISCT